MVVQCGLTIKERVDRINSIEKYYKIKSFIKTPLRVDRVFINTEGKCCNSFLMILSCQSKVTHEKLWQSYKMIHLYNKKENSFFLTVINYYIFFNRITG